MKPNWKVKAVVQKGISFLPMKEKINFWFQKNITKGVALTDEHFGYKITHAKDHLRFFKEYSNVKLNECNVLELGTGWYPIVPIALFLSDVNFINSLDLRNWMTKENFKMACNKFIDWRQRGKLQKVIQNINEEKWEIIKVLSNDKQYDLEFMCQQINLKRWIGDARRTEFNKNSIQFICSNNTIQHISKDILTDILKEFKRIISPEGVMSHFIDMTDHFAHFDKSISIYNFLRFSDQTWNLIDNSIAPQNRMRFIDYKELYKKLSIPITYEEVTKGNIETLKEIPLNPKFKRYRLEDLAISHGYIISKMIKEGAEGLNESAKTVSNDI